MAGYPVIDAFINTYERGLYLAYDKLSEKTKQIIVSELEGHGIDHEIFDRGKKGSAGAGGAKAVESVRQTILRRQNKRGEDFETPEQIISEMHDLAGLRIAVYYPNDLTKVERMITDRFIEEKAAQDWPDPEFGPFSYPKLDAGSARRQSRFPGYYAQHYRVRLKEGDVGSQSALGGRVVEIQVMTLLMHAWSKMHYKLVYKPRPGIPSADEDDERLLDISNGIIIAGEQILRQIQINLDKKIEASRQPFSDQHDFFRHMGQKWGDHFGDSRSHHVWKKMAYEALVPAQYDTPDKLDRLMERGLQQHKTDAVSKPTPKYGILISSIVAQEDFRARELHDLGLPVDSNPYWSIDEHGYTRLVRYKALIVCNALRYYDSETAGLNVVWENRGDFAGPYPSGQELLKLLHPLNTVKDTKLGKSAILRLDELFNYLLDWQDETFKVFCAVSRLGYFASNVPLRLTGHYDDEKIFLPCEEQRECEMTACPLAFVRLLDYCHAASSTDTKMTLAKAFTLLENAETCNDAMVLRGRGQNYTFLANEYRGLRNSRIVVKPERAIAQETGIGIWKTGMVSSGDDEPGSIDPSAIRFMPQYIRKYLERYRGSEAG